MRRLCAALGDPQRRFSSIHVAGSKGKGSTCAFCEAILRAHGLRTGLYTSPHLVDFRERIRVGGEKIPPSSFAELVPDVKRAIESLPDGANVTFFELYTALAFLYFARCNVDLAVCEVGMGGRLDATNVLEPRVTVITPISEEHTRYLGATVEEIAREKAAIVKPSVPAVVNARRGTEVVLAQCARVGARAFLYEKDFSARREEEGTVALRLGEREFRGVKLGLRGWFQVENGACAAMAASLALGGKLEEPALSEGLARVRWPGRFQVVGQEPAFVLDGAMNGESAQALRRALAEEFPGRPLCFVYGASADKDVRATLRALLDERTAALVLTQAQNPRALPVDELRAQVEFAGEVRCAPTVAQALSLARELLPEGGVVCVTGSLYVVGEALDALGALEEE